MDTTTGEVKFGDGATAWASLSAPYSAGAIGLNTQTTNFTTSATHTTMQDEGLTVTASETSGRTWKWTLTMSLYVPGGANGILVDLLRDGVLMHEWSLPTEALSTTIGHGVTFTHIETVATTHASSVFKVQIAAFSTNTQVGSAASATKPRQLLIEDLGVM